MNPMPLRLSRAEWKRVLRWFLLGQSSARIAEESHIDRKKVLEALTLVREAMARGGEMLPLPRPYIIDM